MRPVLLPFLCAFLMLLSAPSRAQDPVQAKQDLKYDTAPAPAPLQFEEEKMQSYKEDPQLDYSHELVQDSWWTRLKNYLDLQYQRFLNWLLGDYETNSVLRFFIELLPYLIILIVISLALWIFSRMSSAGNFLSESEKPQVFLSEEEEIIKSSDISELIRKAVTEENFRLAIRYYFLLILQQLAQKEIIAYEFSKTDEDYVKEINVKPLQLQFKQLTRIYDFVWYGNFKATEDHYLRSKREFEKMQELIQNAHE